MLSFVVIYEFLCDIPLMATIFSPTIAINSNNLFSGTTSGCIVHISIYLSKVGVLPLIQTLIASEEPTLYLRILGDLTPIFQHIQP